MATNNPKKPNFPAKTCPKCGALIHARLHRHEACGWVMADERKVPAVGGKRGGKGKKRAGKRGGRPASGNIWIEDIQAVKALVDRLGAAKLQQLARVFAK